MQGKMGKMEKNGEKNHATKVTKTPKTKRQKYGMNETFFANFSYIPCLIWDCKITQVKNPYVLFKMKEMYNQGL